MNDIKNKLDRITKITEEIFDKINNENIEEIVELVTERGVIVEEIVANNVKYNIDLEKEYRLFSLNEEINIKIQELKRDLKREMELLNKNKKANSIYGKKFENIYFLNKKI